MNEIRNKEKGLTAGALSFALDSLFTCGVQSLQLFGLAFIATALGMLLKYIFVLLMMARYGQSFDMINLFSPLMTHQYFMKNGAYVEIEPALLALFHASLFIWLCVLIGAAHKLLLSYYDTRSISFSPFISIRQLLYIALLLAIPFALHVPEIYTSLPSSLKTIYSYIDSGMFFILLIPGSRLMLTGYFILDKDKNPIQAMQASWTATAWRKEWIYDYSSSLMVNMLIILNLALVTSPFDTYAPGPIKRSLDLTTNFAPMFNTWLHCLMIGLMTAYTYRRLEK